MRRKLTSSMPFTKGRAEINSRSLFFAARLARKLIGSRLHPDYRIVLARGGRQIEFHRSMSESMVNRVEMLNALFPPIGEKKS